MSVARRYYERHALAESLGTQLNNSGWGIGNVREGFMGSSSITPPVVAVHFLPSRYVETQLGRNYTTEKSFTRQAQIDCYMETEPRSDMIADEVADFLDVMFLSITDENGNILGNLYCPDSETISIETTPPVMNQPDIKRWRSVVQVSLRADYY